jgi:hypothetical protein
MSARIVTAHCAAAVMALLSLSCGSSGGVTSSINQRAALTGHLTWNPLQWDVITSTVDRQSSTMSILYGNDVAVRYARSSAEQHYPAGAVLSLVTWKEQEDLHWFGAKVPGQAKSVEFVSVSAGPENQTAYSYEDYEGSPLQKSSSPGGSSSTGRVTYLLSLRASVMP